MESNQQPVTRSWSHVADELGESRKRKRDSDNKEPLNVTTMRGGKEIGIIKAKIENVCHLLARFEHENTTKRTLCIEDFLMNPTDHCETLSQLADYASLARLREVALANESFCQAYLSIAHELEPSLASDQVFSASDSNDVILSDEDDSSDDDSHFDNDEYTDFIVSEHDVESESSDDEDKENQEESSIDVKVENCCCADHRDDEDNEPFDADEVLSGLTNSERIQLVNCIQQGKQLPEPLIQSIQCHIEELHDDDEELDREKEIDDKTLSAQLEENRCKFVDRTGILHKEDQVIERMLVSLDILDDDVGNSIEELKHLIKILSAVFSFSLHCEELIARAYYVISRYERDPNVMKDDKFDDEIYGILEAIKQFINTNKDIEDTDTRNRLIEIMRTMKVRREQLETRRCINEGDFIHEVREVTGNYSRDMKMTDEAIEALQVAAEQFLIELFQKADVIAKHAQRNYVNKKDMRIVRAINK